jgi:uncharacterized membrane protein YhhN
MRFGLIFMSVLLLTTLLVATQRKIFDISLLAKTLLSTIFVLVALTTPHLNLTYFWAIIIALAFCLAGDICLAFDSGKAFLAGLVVFLMGHLVYSATFIYMAKLNIWTIGALMVTSTVSGIVYTWLKPHLGSLRSPVIVYVVVITVMIAAAGTVAGDAKFSTIGRWLVGGGAVFFYLSDLFVARQRFIEPAFLNRAIGLPLYYVGQFLLAFSVGHIG